MGRPGSRVLRIVLGWVIVAAIAAACILAFWNRQLISDHFRASNFSPSPEVAQVMTDLRLTDTGERVFLASQPTIDGSQHFNEQCARVDHAEEGHVLGCYVDDAIHLFGVTDERLGKVVQVTAAHELLHATYSRLRAGEKESLAKRLNTLYEERSAEDAQLTERMEVYAHLSHASFTNELHSVLGTEVRDLPAWLEDYYGRWFTDRESIVDDFEEYHSVFTELQDRASELQTELEALREQYETRSAAYESAVRDFNAASEDLQRRNNAYEFSDNPDEFYRIRGELESWRSELAAELESLQDDAETYEDLRAELKTLGDTSNELDRQLDSGLAPPSTQPEN